MSNVKDVYVRGLMTFDATPWPQDPQTPESPEPKADSQVMGILAQLNLPAWGLRLVWGGHEFVDNPNGGRTAFYHYVIHGQEAVATCAVDTMVRHLTRVGPVHEAYLKDIEGGGPRIHVAEHEARTSAAMFRAAQQASTDLGAEFAAAAGRDLAQGAHDDPDA